MPAIIVRPGAEKVLVEKHGIFTLRADDAAIECNCPNHRGPCGGIEVNTIPVKFRKFELLCLEMGTRFIARQLPRGYEWTGGNLLLHGPWPSKVQNLVDINSPTWGEAMNRDKSDGFEHPERALSMVSTPSEQYVDYVLVGDFFFRDRMSDVEIDV